MNRYDCELVRDDQKWRFKRMTIDNAWVQGDPEISCRTEALAKEDQRPGRSAGIVREIEAVEIGSNRASGGTGRLVIIVSTICNYSHA